MSQTFNEKSHYKLSFATVCNLVQFVAHNLGIASTIATLSIVLCGPPTLVLLYSALDRYSGCHWLGFVKWPAVSNNIFAFLFPVFSNVRIVPGVVRVVGRPRGPQLRWLRHRPTHLHPLPWSSHSCRKSFSPKGSCPVLKIYVGRWCSSYFSQASCACKQLVAAEPLGIPGAAGIGSDWYYFGASGQSRIQATNGWTV